MNRTMIAFLATTGCSRRLRRDDGSSSSSTGTTAAAAAETTDSSAASATESSTTESSTTEAATASTAAATTAASTGATTTTDAATAAGPVAVTLKESCGCGSRRHAAGRLGDLDVANGGEFPHEFAVMERAPARRWPRPTSAPSSRPSSSRAVINHTDRIESGSSPR